MNRTKIIVIGVIMAMIATVVQSIPAFLSQAFALLTIFSALPIYTAARTNPYAGVVAYLATVLLVLFVDPHEALSFLFTNGVVGFSLGICCNRKLKKLTTLGGSSAALAVTSGILNYGLGYPFLGVSIPGILPVQLVLLLLFSFVYNFIYLVFADFVYKKIKSSGITDIGSSQKL